MVASEYSGFFAVVDSSHISSLKLLSNVTHPLLMGAEAIAYDPVRQWAFVSSRSAAAVVTVDVSVAHAARVVGALSSKPRRIISTERGGVTWREIGQGACEGGAGGVLDSYTCEGGTAIAAMGNCRALCMQWDGCGGITYGESSCQLWVSAGDVLAPAPEASVCSDGYGGSWRNQSGGNGSLPVVGVSPGSPGTCYGRPR